MPSASASATGHERPATDAKADTLYSYEAGVNIELRTELINMPLKVIRQAIRGRLGRQVEGRWDVAEAYEGMRGRGRGDKTMASAPK